VAVHCLADIAYPIAQRSASRQIVLPLGRQPHRATHSGGACCVRCLIQATGLAAKRYRLLTKVYFP